ncbi:glycerol-3-phosphate dehydrogenase subunit GlpB [Trueperella bialowiezensis]|uniref:Anaerobic glycerol-3-phosphate dehydrogenase subunit B n=1 Tax=Trueperella bialowiezensis TaxID=312285 RepID=A0A448PFG2_9ACTO|nr:glycerol-3-phosphate dehydrogenase subunit GlpB [Trueperella bialowiezensis]VEI13672.1 Anaerobic glycerol-3-phosphate dehydrogenase subunit B [Trueperella bialowiezensis]
MKIIVIGAGLAGLSSALMAAEAGHRVSIVTRGLGGLGLSTGTLDVYGWRANGLPADDPYGEIDAVVAAQPEHPYGAIGVENVRRGVDWLRETTGLFGENTGKNVLMPTAIGAIRPTAVVQKTMLPAVVEEGKKFLVVGIKQFRDFPAALIADNLARSPLVSVSARATTISLAPRSPEVDSTGTTFARALDGADGLDGPATRDALVQALRGEVRDGETVLLPAILGFSAEAYDEIAAELGAPVGEVPVPPPSIPGRRINDALTNAARAKRIDISLNAQVVGFETGDGEGRGSETGDGVPAITALKVQRAGRVTTEKVDAVIYAGGGLESGTIERDSYGTIRERVFDLPLMFLPPEDPESKSVTGEAVVDGVDIFGCGVKVNDDMLALNGSTPVFTNLHCVGSLLGGARPWSEKSGEGIALGSAVAAVAAISANAQKVKEER